MRMKKGDPIFRFGYTLVQWLAVVISRKLVQICGENCINCLISHKEVAFHAVLTKALKHMCFFCHFPYDVFGIEKI